MILLTVHTDVFRLHELSVVVVFFFLWYLCQRLLMFKEKFFKNTLLRIGTI